MKLNNRHIELLQYGCTGFMSSKGTVRFYYWGESVTREINTLEKHGYMNICRYADNYVANRSEKGYRFLEEKGILF